MKSSRKAGLLTDKELPIMKALWERGPLFVREILVGYPEPKPHQNTVATLVKILEEKGHVGHEVVGNSHRYYAVTPRSVVRERSLMEVIGNFFNNSYKSVVSALVADEKISVDELKEIIRIVEERNKD
ncbi:MAG: BlaI/MecI/CopY family transcriptional regulator [Duncaniella sp.]|nr:BlaI/MecI/CopY family transcriptional regulator [Duncaniella sp.]